MGSIKIFLASNRGSYESRSSYIQDEFDSLTLDVGSKIHLDFTNSSKLSDIQSFIDQHPGKWIIGFMGYDLGFQMIEPQAHLKQSLISFPSSCLMAISPGQIKKSVALPAYENMHTEAISLKALVNMNEYVQSVNKLQRHIQLGDIYEINYCIPFIAENISIDPEIIFSRLNQITPMPFSALIETDQFAIISASPERFMKKKKDRLVIQPMKGTRARIIGNEEQDKKELENDPKERSENVMIVDLTRNDLSKLAKKGTVKVDELYGVYSFPSVLQMISTVSCEIDPNEKFSTILKATFPMGSMTGAPKKRAMQLINEYECFSRGPFSGMLGYIEPNGDFDFSVLIRTIFYDKVKKKLFVAVGSAITCQSNVEKEYEECLIKLQPLLKALNANIS